MVICVCTRHWQKWKCLRSRGHYEWCSSSTTSKAKICLLYHHDNYYIENLSSIPNFSTSQKKLKKKTTGPTPTPHLPQLSSWYNPTPNSRAHYRPSKFLPCFPRAGFRFIIGSSSWSWPKIFRWRFYRGPSDRWTSQKISGFLWVSKRGKNT